MLRYAVWLAIGATLLQIPATIPAGGAVAAAAACGCGCALQPRLHWLGSMLAGTVVIWIAATCALDDRLPEALSGREFTVDLRIEDFRQRTGTSIRFDASPVGQPELPGLLRISWYDTGQEPGPGEIWTLHLRLRRPRGLSNEAGFDYERYLHRRGIGATGYVVSHPDNRRQSIAPWWSVDRLRSKAASRIAAVLPDDPARAVLLAIAVGARGDISGDAWRLYARTGTTHLMAISGLHIGLAAGGASLLSWALLALFSRRENLREPALAIALIAACGYALLSGWAVPAQRACLMLAFGFGAVLLRRRVSAGHAVGLAGILVLLGEPLSLYSPGFLLSFSAVLLLAWHAARLAPGPTPSIRNPLAATVALATLQLSLLFALMPLTVAVFGRLSWLAPAVNLVALPVFSFVTVPCALAGLLLSGPLDPVGDLLLGLSWHSIDRLLLLLQLADELPFVSTEPAVSGPIAALAGAASMLFALLPAGFPGRRVGLLALLAMACYRPAPVPPGCFDLRIFDVGQGLAAAIRTRNYTLVYDSGPAYRGGVPTAAYAIDPWLGLHGIRRIDTMVISHADLDHAGGADWLRARLPVDQQLAGEPQAAGERHCRAGQTWNRDGVRFSVLHPDAAWRGNNASCVLSVRAGDKRVLLPGDLEAAAERALLLSNPVLAADLVVVPHHGSRTSSSAGFVSAISARYAVVSAGYANRWGFPKPDVVARWQDSGATVVSTGQGGSVSARYCANAPPPTVRIEREARRRYWHD